MELQIHDEARKNKLVANKKTTQSIQTYKAQFSKNTKKPVKNEYATNKICNFTWYTHANIPKNANVLGIDYNDNGRT